MYLRAPGVLGSGTLVASENIALTYAIC
jgi:hypothetical protein